MRRVERSTSKHARQGPSFLPVEAIERAVGAVQRELDAGPNAHRNRDDGGFTIERVRAGSARWLWVEELYLSADCAKVVPLKALRVFQGEYDAKTDGRVDTFLLSYREYPLAACTFLPHVMDVTPDRIGGPHVGERWAIALEVVAFAVPSHLDQSPPDFPTVQPEPVRAHASHVSASDTAVVGEPEAASERGAHAATETPPSLVPTATQLDKGKGDGESGTEYEAHGQANTTRKSSNEDGAVTTEGGEVVRQAHGDRRRDGADYCEKFTTSSASTATSTAIAADDDATPPAVTAESDANGTNSVLGHARLETGEVSTASTNASACAHKSSIRSASSTSTPSATTSPATSSSSSSNGSTDYATLSVGVGDAGNGGGDHGGGGGGVAGGDAGDADDADTHAHVDTATRAAVDDAHPHVHTTAAFDTTHTRQPDCNEQRDGRGTKESVEALTLLVLRRIVHHLYVCCQYSLRARCAYRPRKRRRPTRSTDSMARSGAPPRRSRITSATSGTTYPAPQRRSSAWTRPVWAVGAMERAAATATLEIEISAAPASLLVMQWPV